MSTFLEICQDVARESGTAGTGVVPTSVTSQTGQLLKIVNWVERAWTNIQNRERNWRFLEAEFSGPTVASQRFYTAAEMGISTRFGSWVSGDDEMHNPVTFYETAVGESDERRLYWCGWREFRSERMIGEDVVNTPSVYTIAADNTIGFDAVPDKVYTVKGLYRKAPQVLAADGDIPECPARFHDVIMYRALMFLAADEETPIQYNGWRDEYTEIYGRMKRDQRPLMRFGAAMGNNATNP
jgi:hypothetical protein